MRKAIIATTFILAGVDNGEGFNYRELGAAAALVWYMWYNTAVAQPRTEERHKEAMDESNRSHIRDAMAREERFNEELATQRVEFLRQLDAVVKQSSEDRRKTRSVIRKFTEESRRVHEGQKVSAEATVKLAQLIDRRQREDEDELDDRMKRLERDAHTEPHAEHDQQHD